MKKLFTIFMLLISCLVSAQKNQIDWKSLSMNNEVPEWFKNAKFVGRIVSLYMEIMREISNQAHSGSLDPRVLD